MNRRLTTFLQYLYVYLTDTLYGAILQAFKGRACILVTAGLIYPQNVTTPTMMHSMFTI